MIEIKKTDTFEKWIRSLRDKNAIARINIRIKRMQIGNFGDVKPVGEGISELRVNSGPGYRVYFCKYKDVIILLINGGDKSTQNKDILNAKKIRADLGSEYE